MLQLLIGLQIRTTHYVTITRPVEPTLVFGTECISTQMDLLSPVVSVLVKSNLESFATTLYIRKDGLDYGSSKFTRQRKAEGMIRVYSITVKVYESSTYVRRN